MDRTYKQINEIMKLDIDGNDILEFSRCDLIHDYVVQEDGWEKVQEVLFTMLLEDRSTSDYEALASVFWYEICEKEYIDLIDKDKAVALINYRLNPFDNAYEDNLAWSITSNLYHLDYCNSEYNAFRDEKILNILKELNLKF